MAEVWKGHDTVLDRAVAVKILHPHLAGDSTVAERFRREAISAARLSHPHIIPTFDTGVDGDAAFIVMGLVTGMTVRELIDSQKLTPRFVAAVGRQVADALAYAHSTGIVHRDVKPTNVLVVEGTNRVMVADFGIAKAIEDSGDPSLTQPGLVIGTPDYAAPEQLKGEAVDGRTDIYATGVLIHEMVCGHSSTATQPTRLAPVGDASAHPICPEIPAEFAPVVARATAENPDDRYATALEMRDELGDIERRLFAAESVHSGQTPRITGPIPKTPEQGTTVFAPKPAKKPRKSRAFHGSRQSRTALVVMVILVVLAIAFGKFFGSLGTGDGNPQTIPTNPPVSGLQATSFDPSGDGSEHENEARNAVDGNASTAWTTETYNDRRFGTKPGVGLRISLPGEAQLVSMQVASPTKGWTAQIYVSTGSPSSLQDWGSAIETQSGLPGDATFDLHNVKGDSVLLWITDVGDSNRFSASEISVSTRK